MNITIRTSDGSTAITVEDGQETITIQIGKGQTPTVTSAPAGAPRKADR